MKDYLMTKDIAKLANVSERTIRYYDSIGLLKPSSYLDNGYRVYSLEDFERLKRIVGLKNLGFSLVEIKSLLQKEKSNFKEFIDKQIEILEQQINNYEEALFILKDISRDGEEVSWETVDDLINLDDIKPNFSEKYHSIEYINVRKKLHDEFGKNNVKWYDWIQSQLNYVSVNRILDIGCGDGSLWKEYSQNLRNRELYMIDYNKEMVKEANRNLDNSYNIFVMDMENLGFQNNFFDMVIASHVLYYSKNVNRVLVEVCKVLRENGIFYATTYGNYHMKELEKLVKEFDSSIQLSNSEHLNRFGLENGNEILSRYFKHVECSIYEDELYIDSSNILFDYIMSANGNQVTILKDKLDEFKFFLEEYIRLNKVLIVHMQLVIFKAYK